MRLGMIGLAGLLALGGCGGTDRTAVTASIESDGHATTVRCIDSTSGACHVVFATATALRGEIGKGDSRAFEGVATGTAMCVEAASPDLATCGRTTIRQGTQRIARSRVTS